LGQNYTGLARAQGDALHRAIDRQQRLARDARTQPDITASERRKILEKAGMTPRGDIEYVVRRQRQIDIAIRAEQFPAERMKAMAKDYAALSAKDQRSTIVIDPSRAGRYVLNVEIRTQLVASGRLMGEAITMRTLESKGLTKAEARDARSYEVGDVVQFAPSVPLSALAVSSVTAGEIHYGVAKRPQATTLAKLVREFLRYTDILPWSDAVAPHHGTLRAALEAKGVTIAPFDLMIAAHALSIDATLVSADHALLQIDILKIEDWNA
jgi:tRNA(fMet)-specific endonuclease VapC